MQTRCLTGNFGVCQGIKEKKEMWASWMTRGWSSDVEESSRRVIIGILGAKQTLRLRSEQAQTPEAVLWCCCQGSGKGTGYGGARSGILKRARKSALGTVPHLPSLPTGEGKMRRDGLCKALLTVRGRCGAAWQLRTMVLHPNPPPTWEEGI
jgi:hypothetical protein